MAEIDEQHGGDTPQATEPHTATLSTENPPTVDSLATELQATEEERRRVEPSQSAGEIAAGTPPQPPEKKPGFVLFAAIALMVLAAVVVAALVALRPGGLSLRPKPGPNDLGEGVSSASGIRGHLVTEWQGGMARYKLKIEPLDARNQDGFTRAVTGNTQPVYINVRILDAGGNAVCGKQLVLPPKGVAAQADGADAFKRLAGAAGQMEGLWAEGILPCSADEYRRFDYWDLATNFPSVAEQDRMVGIAPPEPEENAAAPEQQPAQAATGGHAASASRARRRAPNKKPQSAFLLQGDDHATAFEPGRNVLTIGPGKSFVVLRAADLQTAAAWADDGALVHYTCDQRAVCALRRSGSSAVVVARMNN